MKKGQIVLLPIKQDVTLYCPLFTDNYKCQALHMEAVEVFWYRH